MFTLGLDASLLQTINSFRLFQLLTDLVYIRCIQSCQNDRCINLFVKKLLLSILILISSFALSLAQTSEQFQFINFSETDGLLDVFIYSCAKDNDGNMWLGTGTGLYKYNGISFTSVKSPIDNASGQIGNILERVFTTSQNKLLLSSLNDFQVFDLTTKKFARVQAQDGFDPTKDEITGFFESKSGEIWLTLKNDFLAKFDPSTRKVTQFPSTLRNQLPQTVRTNKLIEGKNGQLYALTSNGLYHYDPQKQTLKQHSKPADFEGYFTDGLVDETKNVIWLISPTTGLVKFSIETAKLEVIIDKNSAPGWSKCYPSRIQWKKENEIWLGGLELAFFNLSSKVFTSVDTRYEDEHSFRTLKIIQLFNDDGNLWICSHFGLSVLPTINQRVKRIDLQNPVTKVNMEPYETVRLSSGNLISVGGMGNGAALYDLQTGKLTIVPCEGHTGKELVGTYCVERTTSNRVFVGARDGLFELNPTQTKFVRPDLREKNGRALSGITAILSYQQYLVMESINGGFYTYNLQDKSIEHVYFDGKGFTSVENSLSMRPQLIDREGKIWFSLENGLAFYDLKSGKAAVFQQFKDQNNKSCTIDKISGIAQDQTGVFWLSTYDNGFYSFDSKSLKVRNFNRKNTLMLSSDYCFSIHTDKFGNAWIGTLSGLVQFNPSTKQIVRVLKKSQGLVKSNINVGLSMIDGEFIVINHYSALSVFRINELESNPLLPRVDVVEIMGKSRAIKNSYSLNYDENFISLHWSAGIYARKNEVMFAYRLLPGNGEWTFTSNCDVTFVGLPPGDHSFELKTYRTTGTWSPVERISITIHPPFYQTWWFRSMVALLFIGIIFSIYRWNIRRIKRSEALKSKYIKEVSELELKALRAQMNPHFIFNSLNSIQKYILKNDTFNTSQYLTKFSRLIRLILENSSETHLSLADEIEQIKLYVEIEQLRFENRFEFELRIDPALQPDFIKIPTMVIQPYVENAIWHGLLHKNEVGHLLIHLSKSDVNTVQIVIEDDGVGREVSGKMKTKQVFKKKSLGMKITEDRIGLLNKSVTNHIHVAIEDVFDEEQKVRGTKVILIIEIPTA